MSIIQVQAVMAEHPDHTRAPHPAEHEYGTAFCQGRIVPVQEASVPLVDCGFLHADAAYDVVTVSRGVFFRLEEHLTRMEESCRRFALTNPYSRSEVKDILSQMVATSGLKDAYVWWCVTRGPLPEDRTDLSKYQNAMFAFATPYLFQAPDEMRTRGFDLIISKEYERISPKAVDPKAKNFHWMDMKMSLFEAVRAQKDWSVLTDADGYLTEAPGANIFFIKNGEMFTPADGCLLGITRKSVIELATELGLKVSIGNWPADDLLKADEAFTCSSAGGIMPIRSVDDQVLGGTFGPGPITTKLHNMYWEKRWSGWHATPVNYAHQSSTVAV